MSELKDVIWTQNGFDDLKKYCHKSNEFLRDAASLFNERAKLEIIYAEGLAKISAKARKICTDTFGTTSTAWETLATQTDSEANLHRSRSSYITDEVSKPLKTFADAQKESRKNAEQVVEKASKLLADKRSKEAQAKKSSFNKAKDSENFTVQLESARSKTLSEKELSKLDMKCKKAEEGIIKLDNDYISKILDAERARLDLESSITSSTMVLQNLEEERIVYFQKLLQTYSDLLERSTPDLDGCFKAIKGGASSMDTGADMTALIEMHGSKRLPSEQVVFSCFEEDLQNPMDNTRRKLAIENKIEKLQRALHGEKKARKGLTRLNSVYQDTPSFSTKNAQQSVGFQLGHTKNVMNLLEASIYRLNCALSKLCNSNPPAYSLSQYIDERKDKQGIMCCTLRVPFDGNNIPGDEDDDIDEHEYMPASEYRSTYQSYPDSRHNDDDSDVDPDFEDEVEAAPADYSSIDMCKALYEYNAAEKDELTIKPGDIISIVLRHDDGWWKGELRGKVGLFPSAYVQEYQ